MTSTEKVYGGWSFTKPNKYVSGSMWEVGGWPVVFVVKGTSLARLQLMWTSVMIPRCPLLDWEEAENKSRTHPCACARHSPYL